MKGSAHCSRAPGDLEMGSTSNSEDNILNLKYSDLPSSQYNCFMCGFQDEQAFEEFKHDLRDFQKLKNDCCSDSVNGGGHSDDLIDLNELQFICRPNYVCKNRRGNGRKSLPEFKQKPLLSTGRPVSRPTLPSCVSSPEPLYIKDTVSPRDSPEQSYKSLRSEKSDPIAQRDQSNRTSSLLDIESNCGIEPSTKGSLNGFLDFQSNCGIEPSSKGSLNGFLNFQSNCGIEPSTKDSLNGFLDKDENFKEFDRVFETVTSRCISKDLDVNRRMSSKRRSGSCKQVDNESCDRTSKNMQHLSQTFVSDLFSDFFDNDDSFLEFEKEFDKFRFNRRSNCLENLNNTGSRQNILEDPNPFCDINMNSRLDSPSDSLRCCSQAETILVDGDEIRHNSLVISSAEDLRKVLIKLKSRLQFDTSQPVCLCQHRHSVHGVPGINKQSEGHRLNRSSDGLSRYLKLGMTPCPWPDLTSNKVTKVPHPVGGLIHPSLLNLGGTQTCEQDFTNSNLPFIHTNNNDDDSSSGKIPFLHTNNNDDDSSSGNLPLLHTNNNDDDSSSGNLPLLHTNNNDDDSSSSKIPFLHTNNKDDNSSSGNLHFIHTNNTDDDYLRDYLHFLNTSKDEDDSLMGSVPYLYMNNCEDDSQSSQSHFPHNNKTNDDSLRGSSSFLHISSDDEDDFVQVNPKSPHMSNIMDDSHWGNPSFLHTDNNGRDYIKNRSSAPHLRNYEDDSSNTKWTDTLGSDGRDSPISAHCSSPSCFCQSDLHIEEPCGEVTVDSKPSRSQSLMELGNQSLMKLGSHSMMELGSQSVMEMSSKSRYEDHRRLHTNSMGHLKVCLESDTSRKDRLVQRTPCQILEHQQSSDLDSDHNYIYTDIPENRPSSAASSEHSDADSEYYHTATSDLSGRYSTAKSHLSVFVGKPGSEFSDGCLNFDLSEESSPTAGLPVDVFDVAELQGDRAVVRRQRHSYHGGSSQAKYKLDRPRSGSACQYTCHQHCVSSVTLSCKSGESCDVSAASSPSTPSPRPILSNIHSRPGSAVIVPGFSSTTRDTTETTPNFQQISPRMGRNVGAYQELPLGYTDTPKASSFNLPTHLRPRSVREDLVTAHIPQPNTASGPAPESSKSQLISSPQCLPTYPDSHSGSQHHKDSPRHHPQPHSASNISAPASTGISINKDTQGDASTTTISHARSVDMPAAELPKDNATCFPDVGRTDEETNQDAATEKDETDSGYRSGTIPDDKLPRVPSQTTLDQQELIRKVAKFNHFVPAVSLEVSGKESFQGFLKVTMNLIRPITMELGARPPSIYELLTREHIIEENTQHVAFYMPRDTHKSLHITSDTTTKEVIASLLKKFHILDHPRKFAMYDQEFSDRNKLVRLRRLTDKDCPLRAMVNWDPERIRNYRMVLQENETGEIMWEAFSLPELNNFLRVLDREEKETIIDLKHKYAYMKQYMERRMVELRSESNKNKNNT